MTPCRAARITERIPGFRDAMKGRWYLAQDDPNRPRLVRYESTKPYGGVATRPATIFGPLFTKLPAYLKKANTQCPGSGTNKQKEIETLSARWKTLTASANARLRGTRALRAWILLPVGPIPR